MKSAEENNFFVSVADGLSEARERINKRQVGERSSGDVKTGFEQLDLVLGGFYKSNLIFVGGKLSDEKEAFKRGLLRHSAPNILLINHGTVNDLVGKIFELKCLATSLNIPVLIFSPIEPVEEGISMAVERILNFIVRTSDVVLYFNKENCATAEIFVAKNINGPLGLAKINL